MIKVLIRKRLIMGEYNKSNEYGINPDCEYSALPEEINKPGNEYNNSAKEFNFSWEAEYNKSEDAKQQDFQSIGKKNQKSLRNIMKLGATAVAVFVLSTLMVNNGGDTLFGFSYTNDYINKGNMKNEISDNTYKPDDSSGKGKGTSEIPDADNANYTVKLVKVSDETYSDVTAVTDNLLVASKNGKWGLIDGSGKVVKDFIYDSAMVFKYDFIGYVLVTNNSDGSTQQIFDSDNKLVYTRECEPNENIIGYTEGYVHIRKDRTKEEIARTKNNLNESNQVGEYLVYGDVSTVDKDVYVYIENGQIISEISIDGMDYYRVREKEEKEKKEKEEQKRLEKQNNKSNSYGAFYGSNSGASCVFYIRDYDGSPSVANGYIIPYTYGDYYYKMEAGKAEYITIEIPKESGEEVRCRQFVSSNYIYVDLYEMNKGKASSPYASLERSYLYNVETKEAVQVDTVDNVSDFSSMKYGEIYNKSELFSKGGYMFGIINERGEPAGNNSYYVVKKLYALNKDNVSAKITTNVDEVLSSYIIGDKEILFVKKDNKYGYVTNNDFNNIKWYVYDASDFSESGYAIATDTSQYNDIIDTDFNVVGRVEKGTYSMAHCNYYLKEVTYNTYTLYRLEKIK